MRSARIVRVATLGTGVMLLLGAGRGALDKSGAVADMKRRGVEHLSYFQVDNPLVDVADPGRRDPARAEARRRRTSASPAW